MTMILSRPPDQYEPKSFLLNGLEDQEVARYLDGHLTFMDAPLFDPAQPEGAAFQDYYASQQRRELTPNERLWKYLAQEALESKPLLCHCMPTLNNLIKAHHITLERMTLLELRENKTRTREDLIELVRLLEYLLLEIYMAEELSDETSQVRFRQNFLSNIWGQLSLEYWDFLSLSPTDSEGVTQWIPFLESKKFELLETLLRLQLPAEIQNTEWKLLSNEAEQKQTAPPFNPKKLADLLVKISQQITTFPESLINATLHTYPIFTAKLIAGFVFDLVLRVYSVSQATDEEADPIEIEDEETTEEAEITDNSEDTHPIEIAKLEKIKKAARILRSQYIPLGQHATAVIKLTLTHYFRQQIKTCPPTSALSQLFKNNDPFPRYLNPETALTRFFQTLAKAYDNRQITQSDLAFLKLEHRQELTRILNTAPLFQPLLEEEQLRNLIERQGLDIFRIFNNYFYTTSTTQSGSRKRYNTIKPSEKLTFHWLANGMGLNTHNEALYPTISNTETIELQPKWLPPYLPKAQWTTNSNKRIETTLKNPLTINTFVLDTLEEYWSTPSTSKRTLQLILFDKTEASHDIATIARARKFFYAVLYLQAAIRLFNPLREVHLDRRVDWRGRLYYLGILSPTNNTLCRALFGSSKSYPMSETSRSAIRASLASTFSSYLPIPSTNDFTTLYDLNQLWLNNFPSTPSLETIERLLRQLKPGKRLAPLMLIHALYNIPDNTPCNCAISLDCTASGAQIISSLFNDQKTLHLTNVTCDPQLPHTTNLWNLPIQDFYIGVLNELQQITTNTSSHDLPHLPQLTRKIIKALSVPRLYGAGSEHLEKAYRETIKQNPPTTPITPEVMLKINLLLEQNKLKTVKLSSLSTTELSLRAVVLKYKMTSQELLQFHNILTRLPPKDLFTPPSTHKLTKFFPLPPKDRKKAIYRFTRCFEALTLDPIVKYTINAYLTAMNNIFPSRTSLAKLAHFIGQTHLTSPIIWTLTSLNTKPTETYSIEITHTYYKTTAISCKSSHLASSGGARSSITQRHITRDPTTGNPILSTIRTETAFAANFIHSLDALLLRSVLTTLYKEHKISPITIHDAFIISPLDTHILHQTFVKLFPQVINEGRKLLQQLYSPLLTTLTQNVQAYVDKFTSPNFTPSIDDIKTLQQLYNTLHPTSKVIVTTKNAALITNKLAIHLKTLPTLPQTPFTLPHPGLFFKP